MSSRLSRSSVLQPLRRPVTRSSIPRRYASNESFKTRLNERLKETPIKWKPIPIGLGIAVLAVLTLSKQRSSQEAQPDSHVAVKGPWQVHVIGALPLRTISRIYGALNSYELPVWFRTPGYKFYAWIFGVDLSECEIEDLRQYKSLSEFFMRKLKPGLRPASDSILISPADGRVVNFGYIENRRVEQVKGVTYSLDALLSGAGPTQAPSTSTITSSSTAPPHPDSTSHVDEESFANINDLEYSVDDLIGDEQLHPEALQDGDATHEDPKQTIVDHANVALSVAPGNMPWTVKGVPKPGNAMFFAVVYLAPGDYHRFHSPTAWVVERRRHFAGELFSVSPYMSRLLADLFVLNERVALLGRWRHGFFSMVPVGATNVGSIKINFDRDLRTNERKRIGHPGQFAEANYHKASKILNGKPLQPADEMGGFMLGSTIVLVFEAPKDFKFSCKIGQKIKVGESMGDIPS